MLCHVPSSHSVSKISYIYIKNKTKTSSNLSTAHPQCSVLIKTEKGPYLTLTKFT